MRYGRDGGRVGVGLRQGTAEEGAYVELTVEDDGIGLDADELSQIFEEFYRASSDVAGLRPGMGLGLTIVERVVTRHAGSIVVTSEPGVGSTFVVRLPARRQASATEA
ncbi:MAG TPA: ATP-binding protein [Nocardioides sp.]